MAVAVADKRGMKRICTSCGTRFYDFNNRPVICPNCQTEFTGEVKAKSRRGRAAASEDEGQVGKPQKARGGKVEDQSDDDDDLEDDDDMVVSLDDVDEMDDDDDDELGALGLDDDDDDDIDDLDDLDDDSSLEDELDAEGPDGAIDDDDK